MQNTWVRLKWTNKLESTLGGLDSISKFTRQLNYVLLVKDFLDLQGYTHRIREIALRITYEQTA